MILFSENHDDLCCYASLAVVSILGYNESCQALVLLACQPFHLRTQPAQNHFSKPGCLA